MKTRVLLLGAAAALALCGSAQAGHANGWYIGLEGGANWVDDNDVQATLVPLIGVTATYTATLEFDAGWAVLGTVGYAFENNWRIEGEAGYRHNEFTNAAGDLNEWSLMVNVLYDIPLSDRLVLSLGAGAGADNAELKAGTVSDRDWNFAYQGIAGLSYALSDRWDLTLNYRYLNVAEPSFEIPFGGTLTFDFDDFRKHTVTLGLRFDLSPDEVKVVHKDPDPRRPDPPRSYVIFFGFGKCNITQEADGVLSEAASAARHFGQVSVRIVGHTDTVGSAGANQSLSECRANAAKTNLTGKGIPASAISASGRGENQLMVQTGNNVKEPQNRRATIDF